MASEKKNVCSEKFMVFIYIQKGQIHLEDKLYLYFSVRNKIIGLHISLQ